MTGLRDARYGWVKYICSLVAINILYSDYVRIWFELMVKLFYNLFVFIIKHFAFNT